MNTAQMSDREVDVLVEACRMVGEDPNNIQPVNPWTKQGKKAQMIQMACAEIDPEQAALWRRDQGHSVSVATLAECRSGNPLSDKARQDLWNHDPSFVRESIAESQNRIKEDEAALQKAYEEKRLKNRIFQCGGNERMAKEQIRIEDAKNAEEARKKAVWAAGGMV